MSRHLAFDLGAQSGRAMLATLSSGALALAEVHRFANQPVRENGALRWNAGGLWDGIRRGLAAAGPVDSVGIDSWGVDYALVEDRGALVENPCHYRDHRTDGVMAALLARVGREELYGITGIQSMPINTLCQLLAACRDTPAVVERARTLLTIADYYNYRLTGRRCAEYTLATTTQCIDARRRIWADDLLNRVGIPARLFAPLVEPGTLLGRVDAGAGSASAETVVVATASHDTASAVAAVSGLEHTAFLSSGTWSLLGVECQAPVLSAAARELNFTNEGGFGGTIRLLKNISGLWLLEACRESWAAAGVRHRLDDLLEAARAAPPFRALIDPDDAQFLNPDDMPSAIDRCCERTGQPIPPDPAAHVRTILESLACKYRLVVERLEQITGRPIKEIRIIGGGSRNRLLNQFTADATGRRVTAGPVEATSLGNIAVQLVATGAMASLGEARAAIDRAFPVERFEPIEHDRWDAHHRRFMDVVEVGCG